MKTGLLVAVFGLLVAFGAWLLSNQNKGEASTEFTNLYVAQYSDRHITENAIKKDPRFEGLAFVDPKKLPEKPFETQLASVFDILSFLFPEKPRTDLATEYGAWIWTPTLEMTDAYMDKILTELKSRGVNTVYLSVDSYLDIYSLSDRNQKRKKEQEFSDKISQFISKAKENGMTVDAEAGWRNWAEDGHTYKALVIVDFIKRYNDSHIEKLRGVQYDVEPYLLEQYKQSDKGKKEVLQRFIRLIDQTADSFAGSTLEFSVVLPDFYDKKDETVPTFSYAGKKASAFEHVLRVLEKVPQSSVVIMSYRNFAEGKDGSIDISKNEMKTAEHGKYSSEIIIAQETGDVPPPYITFNGKSHPYFEGEIQKVRAAFFNNPNFGGVAVHYANAFVGLGN